MGYIDKTSLTVTAHFTKRGRETLANALSGFIDDSYVITKSDSIRLISRNDIRLQVVGIKQPKIHSIFVNEGEFSPKELNITRGDTIRLYFNLLKLETIHPNPANSSGAPDKTIKFEIKITEEDLIVDPNLQA